MHSLYTKAYSLCDVVTGSADCVSQSLYDTVMKLAPRCVTMVGHWMRRHVSASVQLSSQERCVNVSCFMFQIRYHAVYSTS